MGTYLNVIKEGELRTVGQTSFMWVHPNFGALTFRNVGLFIDIRNIQNDLQPEYFEDTNQVWNELMGKFWG